VPAEKLFVIQPIQRDPTIASNINSFTTTTNHKDFLIAHTSSLCQEELPVNHLAIQDSRGLAQVSKTLILAAAHGPANFFVEKRLKLGIRAVPIGFFVQ
jgi:hypothetical protein